MRLAEAGIHDAQGLVAANPLHLTRRTPFSLPQVIDWIGQACLLVQLKPDLYRRLREQGLRTAWQLYQLVELRAEERQGLVEEAPDFAPAGGAPPPARLEAAGGPPLPPDRARTLLALLEADPAVVRAGEVARCMRAARERLAAPGVEVRPRGS